MNSRSLDLKKSHFFWESGVIYSTLIARFPFLPPVPPKSKTSGEGFIPAMVSLCEWEMKCKEALKDQATTLSTRGCDKGEVELTKEAVKCFYLPERFKMHVWGAHYETLMWTLRELGLFEHSV